MQKCNWRDLTAYNIGVILALGIIVGGPLAGAMYGLLRVTSSAFPAVLARCSVSSDTLAGIGFAGACLLLGLAMWIGCWFLRRFLRVSENHV